MAYDFRIKTFTDERAYHNTAILIYLKAVKAALGDVDVTIGNSLNQGYYSYINKGGAQLTNSDIHKIRDMMDRFIAQDLEIVIEKDNVGHAKAKWASLGYPEKAKLLEGRPDDELVEIANLHNYRNCMYSDLLPSSGYIDLYDIRPYRQGLLLRLPNALHGHAIPKYRDDDKLYEAYAECRRIRRYTRIDYLADLNEQIKLGNINEVIEASEWLQARQLEEFAIRVVEERKKVVLIAGPSSSGKTTTAKRICEEIGRLTGEDPLYLGTDDYFVERGMTPLGPDGKPDFEGLGAVDLPLFNKQMEELLNGETVDLPEFDFMNGTKVFGKRITSLKEHQVLVPLTQIAVDRHNRVSTADARLLRRMVRDNQFRGYNAEATLAAWPKVRAGESVNIFPYSSSADVVFNSSTVYETNLLKTYAEPLLLAIDESSEQYAEAKRILRFMKYFDRIESDEAVPDNAILREFIGPRK